MNKVILCGRCVRDLEVKYNGDKAVVRFTLAVDRRYSKNEERKADFINCVAFGNIANFASNYFKKGDPMTLEGRIMTSSYTNREGKTVYSTDVVADSIEFALGGKRTNDNNNNQTVSNDNNSFMNIPDGVEDELPFN